MIMSKSFKIILLMTLLCSCSIDNYSNASSEITDIDTIEKNSSSTFNDYEEKETNINILTSERESYLIESIINLYNSFANTLYQQKRPFFTVIKTVLAKVSKLFRFT
jgi:hypothetical protein